MLDFELARTHMVDNQVRPADVTDNRIIGALLSVPREAFVPPSRKAFAYMDEDVLLKEAGGVRRYLMEPAPFARLIHLAEIRPGDLVLDVGCTTGYSTAILASLAESVVALESDSELAEAASAALVELDIGNAAVVEGPLAAGYPGEGPYDVIVLEGAVGHVPQALLDQLRDGGRLVGVRGTGGAGQAMLYRRSGTDVAGLPAFNCAVRPLPGFEVERAFTF